MRVTLLSAPSSTCGHFLMARSSSACVCCAAASSLYGSRMNATHEASAGLSSAMAEECRQPRDLSLLTACRRKGGLRRQVPGGLVTPSLKTATKTLSLTIWRYSCVLVVAHDHTERLAVVAVERLAEHCVIQGCVAPGRHPVYLLFSLFSLHAVRKLLGTSKNSSRQVAANLTR